MDLVGSKVLVIFLMFIIKLISGLIPLLFTKSSMIRKARIFNQFVGASLCFGGGVLIATVFVHMLPETRESLESAAGSGYLPETHYPLAELFVCLGFFLIYFVETFVHRIFKVKHSHGNALPITMVQNSGDVDQEMNSKNAAGVDNAAFESEATGPGKSAPDAHHKDVRPNGRHHVYNISSNHASGNVYNVSSATLTSYTSYSDGDSLDNSLPTTLTPHNAHLEKNRDNSSRSSLAESNLKKEFRVLQLVRNVLIVMALSLHSVFEGMAIGLQTSKSDVFTLFVAIAIHAVPVLFCIGMDMVSNGTKKKALAVYIFILALISPVGIAIGMLVTYHADGAADLQTLAIGILQGMAAGTLLYIAFYEVLEKEKLKNFSMSGVRGFVFLFIGFAFLAGLHALTGHEHHHHHGGSVGGHEGHLHGGHDVHGHGDDHGSHDDHDHMENLQHLVESGMHKHDHDEHDDHEDNNLDHDHDDHHHHGEHDHEEHDHEEHDHEEHDHEDHDHEDHAQEEHDHEDHAQEEHDHEDHAQEEHDHEDHDHEDHEDHKEHGDEEHEHEDHEDHAGHGDEDHDHEEHGHEEHDHEPHIEEEYSDITQTIQS